MSAPSRPRPARLLALIEDLLDYSKIEAGRFDPEPQPMSLREIADNIVELLAARAFAKDIGLGCHVEPDVPQMITADPGPGAAGAAQPHRQRHQVHRQRRRAGQRRARPHRDQRPHLLHRHRHRPRPARRGHGAHLRGVRAGRRHLDARAWRRRAGTCHLQAPGGCHGRHDLGLQPTWPRARNSSSRSRPRRPPRRRRARRTCLPAGAR